MWMLVLQRLGDNDAMSLNMHRQSTDLSRVLYVSWWNRKKNIIIKHRVMRYSAELKSNDYACNIIVSYITSQQNVKLYSLLQHMVIDL
jgi:hypothetical protein